MEPITNRAGEIEDFIFRCAKCFNQEYVSHEKFALPDYSTFLYITDSKTRTYITDLDTPVACRVYEIHPWLV